MISIPYGAIKRKAVGELLSKLHQISIPYGAIKSNSSNVIIFYLFIFQFLMVRLKVHTLLPRAIVSQISIPYGAIKSKLLNIRHRAICRFQFLMVRLKENYENGKFN